MGKKLKLFDIEYGKNKEIKIEPGKILSAWDEERCNFIKYFREQKSYNLSNYSELLIVKKLDGILEKLHEETAGALSLIKDPELKQINQNELFSLLQKLIKRKILVQEESYDKKHFRYGFHK